VLFLVSRIIKLEYLMGRNNSPGLEVLELEDSVFSGRSYWSKRQRLDTPDHILSSEDKSAADRVIQQIMDKKKARIDLAEDMALVQQRLLKMNEWPSKLNIDNLRIETILDYLGLQYQSSFYTLLYGLHALHESFLEKKEEVPFQRVWKAL